MNVIKFLLVATVMTCSFCVFAKTGYVNIGFAIEKTNQGKRVKRKVETKLKVIQKSIRAIESDLAKQRASLEKEAPTLSEQKRAQKIQRFQQNVLESQKKAEAKQLEFKKYEEQMMSPILKNMNVVIAKVAKKEGFAVVKNADASVLWVDSSLDLTKKVHSQFNKSYK